MCWLVGNSCTDFVGTPRLLCPGALLACLGAVLGEIMATWKGGSV